MSSLHISTKSPCHGARIPSRHAARFQPLECCFTQESLAQDIYLGGMHMTKQEEDRGIYMSARSCGGVRRLYRSTDHNVFAGRQVK